MSKRQRKIADPPTEVVPPSALKGPCPVEWFASMEGNCPLCLQPKRLHFARRLEITEHPESGK